MKEHGILFKGEMVRAILDDRKVQTRRVFPVDTMCLCNHEFREHNEVEGFTSLGAYGKFSPTKQRYHKGDRLWVRETFKPMPHLNAKAYYRATDLLVGGAWKPSIFMPRWASRITLEVTGVRVERLQDISKEDALAEGISKEILESLLMPTALRQKTKPEHWINGCDAGQSYCLDCCEKKVLELLAAKPNEEYCVGGGWGIEGDSISYCETCSALLSNSLTDYGAESEFDHFLEAGVNLKSPSDCYSLLTAVESQLWEDDRFPHDTDFQYQQRCDRHSKMHRLAYRVLWDSINANPKPVCDRNKQITHYVSYPWGNIHETREHRGKPWLVHGNPWVFAITFKRI